MSAGKRRGCLRNLILGVLVITALIIQLEKNLSQTLLDMAFARAYSMAVETLNSAVHQVMETGVSYEELMDIARECLKVAARSGAPKVSAYIKVVYSPNGEILTIEQKTAKYQ